MACKSCAERQKAFLEAKKNIAPTKKSKPFNNTMSDRIESRRKRIEERNRRIEARNRRMEARNKPI